jgi:hypothetical protein
VTSCPGEAEERARKQKRAKKRDRALIMSFRRTGDSFKHWSEKHNTFASMGCVGFYHHKADYPAFIPAGQPILAKFFSTALGQKEH